MTEIEQACWADRIGPQQKSGPGGALTPLIPGLTLLEGLAVDGIRVPLAAQGSLGVSPSGAPL